VYVTPVKNRLRTLPVRQYQGPFPTRLPGLGAIDIGTSATVDVTPAGATVMGEGASAGYQQTSAAPSPSFTDWLNQNSSTVLWIGGIGLGVLLLARMAR
jgi:hypothetical protein